jgi:hypothetical protein
VTSTQAISFTIGVINGSIETMEKLLDTQEFEEYCDHAESMIASLEEQLSLIK